MKPDRRKQFTYRSFVVEPILSPPARCLGSLHRYWQLVKLCNGTQIDWIAVATKREARKRIDQYLGQQSNDRGAK